MRASVGTGYVRIYTVICENVVRLNVRSNRLGTVLRVGYDNAARLAELFYLLLTLGAFVSYYYLKPREGRAEPSNVYNSTTLHFLKSPEATIMFDNLSSYCDNGLYTPIKLQGL